MASTLSISRTICFTLVQLIILNIANSEYLTSYHNATDYESPREQVRSKRSLFDRMPFSLRLRVENPTGSPIDLLWIKIKPYLANKYLPVVTHGFETNPNVMNDVGEFIVYHDSLKCSAVVYFEKLRIFRGVIGTNLFIHDLPFDFDSKGKHRLGVVGYPFVIKYVHTFGHIFPPNHLHLTDNEEIQKYSTIPSASNSNGGIKRPSDSDPSPSSKHQRSKRNLNVKNHNAKFNASANGKDNIRKRRSPIGHNRYLEILVFITRDIAQIFKNFYGQNEYIQWIVRFYIVYFNAVDMMFHKLAIPHHQLIINIAKIVIEDDSQPFDFTSVDGSRFTGISEKLPEYLQTHNEHYPYDSFDHIFISTTHVTTDAPTTVHGQTKHGANIFEARKNNHFYDAIPISLVEYYYSDYLIAVHEIAKTFNMMTSSSDNGLTSSGQCYGIMQKEGPKCDDCLIWRDEDHIQFETFFRENTNRCFLLNEPRSIHPPGPSNLISFGRQCTCYGYAYNPWRMNKQNTDRCAKPLVCHMLNANGPRIHTTTILPFDGTPCAHAKVCWREQCVPSNKLCPSFISMIHSRK